MNLCLFGASSRNLDAEYYRQAAALGKLLAENGHTLVFGGGAEGLMGACATGVLNVGGRVIGIAPRFFDEPGILLPGCTEMIITETMAERKEKMLAMSEGFLVLPGGIGTMDEFFEVITLRQLGRLRGRIVLLDTLGFYRKLTDFLRSMADHDFMSESCLQLFETCETPEAALQAVLKTDNLAGSVRRLEDYCR
ncbi:MAG: TIGR00730 family Rossman fold protein [Oscillospiraceae bacterium]|nr:TIGR00730 family Rossman fold protein [Oscillospiraceae bacterium]